MSLDSYSIFIVSKYFNSISDYINVIKTNKMYKSIISNYQYNPISLKNKKERNLFGNIKEYHIYTHKDSRFDFDSNLKHIYYHNVNFEDAKNGKYENIILTRKNINKYFNNELIDLSNYENITLISRSCFYKFTNLTNVKLPNSVKCLSDNCFSKCSNLKRN